MSTPFGAAVRRTARLLGLLTVVFCAGPLASAVAATWTVNTTIDPSGPGDCAGAGICSLRQAIADASTGDSVQLPSSATPYGVTRGVIAISQGITITGAAANTTTIQGNGSSQIFDVSGLAASSALTISGVTITGGDASGITAETESGGAIYDSSPDATVDIAGVTLSGNTSSTNGGAIELAGGSMDIADSTLGPDNVAIGNSDFAGSGGAIDNDNGTLAVTDTTITGNSAGTTVNGALGGEGGGISDESGGVTGTTMLRYDTIVSNTVAGSEAAGGNLFTDTNDPDGFTIADTIVAGGVATTTFVDCYPDNDFISQGDNLTDESISSDASACGFTQSTDVRGNPQLGALANNGGPTETELPAAGSPEIDAIPSSNPSCTGTDQRGVTRPQGTGCTIGAVEGSSSSGGSPSADLALSASAPSTIAAGQPLTDTFTLTDNGPDAAFGVTFNDPLPNGVTLVAASASQGSCSGTTTVSCTIGLVTVGNPQTVSVVVDRATAGQVSNTATVLASPDDDPNPANDSATATTTVTGTPPCQTSMTLDAVEVLAGCITERSDGTYLATGATSFGDGARIVDAGTATPATLVIDPSSHTISIAPASGGGAQSGELQAGGRDIATGDLVIGTQAHTDPVSGVAGSAPVTGLSSVDVTLSGWAFDESGAVAPTAYLAPSSAGGGAIVDGQLTLPAWLGDALKFGTLVASGLVPGASGELAVQADSSGTVSVVNGGISFKATVLGDSNLQLANAELAYQRAGDEWTGSGALGFASLVKLNVNATIGDGKLDDLGVDFACGTSKICGSSSSLPTLGAILDIKDVDLNVINLQGVDYTPPPTIGIFHIPTPCFPSRFRTCPPPQPAPQVDGAVIVGLLGDRVIAGGDFDYLLDGQFTASGGVGLAPLYGSTFSAPPPLAPGQSASNVVSNLLSSGKAGVELAGATINYTPPGLLQATGTVFLPPPPFPFQFLKGTISIGIDASHFTGEGSLDLVIPSYVPVVGNETFAGVQALISDEAAAAQASVPQYCVTVDLGFHTYRECTPKITFLAAFDWATGRVSVDLNGGNIDDYATVPQLTADDAVAVDSRFVHVPAGKQLASFTVRGLRGTPNVELISPPVGGHRRDLTLATSKRLRNRTGALAWVDHKAHTESFLVFAPDGGRWTVKRLRGARIASVKLMVPHTKLPTTVYPHAVERGSDLPKGTVSTAGTLTLHYRVANAEPGTTVDVWAGTGPHGAGGTMIADGLPPAGGATWRLSGLASGRYYPYAIVSQHGIPVSIQYWPGSVEVVNASAPPTPTGVQASVTDAHPPALAGGQAYVAWNGVDAAQTYAVTATPAGGGAPVRDAVPASQVADLLTLRPGTWSITVQAVDGADAASLPSTPVGLTVS